MKTIQRIGILFILLVFLFGTTGLSVLHHFCNSSNRGDVTIYPEFFKNPNSSCCEDASMGYACAVHIKPAVDQGTANIDAAPCCKSTISFIKLEILTIRVEKLALQMVTLEQPCFSHSSGRITPVVQPLVLNAYYQFHSPPLFGRVLVHFLHQMKIPAHPPVA